MSNLDTNSDDNKDSIVIKNGGASINVTININFINYNDENNSKPEVPSRVKSSVINYTRRDYYDD